MKGIMVSGPEMENLDELYEAEKPKSLGRGAFIAIMILLGIFTAGMTAADIVLWLDKEAGKKEPAATVDGADEVRGGAAKDNGDGQSGAEDASATAEDERPETEVLKAEAKSETEISLPRPVEILAIAGEPNIQIDAPTALRALEDYINARGIEASFGYVNLATGYTYMSGGDKIYYGASLVKTLDAMYAYEKLGGNLDAEARKLLINSVTYSKNEAHNALVEKFGRENLKRYAEEIGMKYHLKGSSIYDDTYYFCDTTVRDQITEWKRLWYLVNNLSNGHELLEMFSVGWWGVLQFPGHPQFMFKAGFYGPYYSETGLFLSRSPYIFVLLTKNGYRADKDYIMSDLSRRIYEINETAE